MKPIKLCVKFKINLYSLLIISFFYLPNSLLATGTDSLFKSEDVINIELRSDFTSIQNDRPGNAEYHPGELVYHTSDGETKTFSVKIIIRGHFRRDTAHCNFPPLFVNFKKNEVKNTLFENQDKLKLVTPCQYEKDVINEYLIYKMYNQVTDLSMKARLVKVLYYDTIKKKKIFEKFSFFIEDKEHCAERNNVFERDKVVSPFSIDRESFKRMAVFEYIVGNADWYFTLRHNIVIMQPKDTTLAPYAVPYDFDLSGFVDADYALPKKGDEKALTKRRIYKGLCYSEGEFNEVFDYYRKMRPVFESIIDNMELVSKPGRKKMTNYIDYFYSVIDNKKLIRQEFIDPCEKTIDYRISQKIPSNN